MLGRTKLIFALLINALALGFPTKRDAESVIVKDEATRTEGKAGSTSSPIFGGLQQWVSDIAGSGTMMLGTYQALLMPMQQGQNLASGIGNVAQGIQGLFQG